jgi:hypothetical protein
VKSRLVTTTGAFSGVTMAAPAGRTADEALNSQWADIPAVSPPRAHVASRLHLHGAVLKVAIGTV